MLCVLIVWQKTINKSCLWVSAAITLTSPGLIPIIRTSSPELSYVFPYCLLSPRRLEHRGPLQIETPFLPPSSFPPRPISSHLLVMKRTKNARDVIPWWGTWPCIPRPPAPSPCCPADWGCRGRGVLAWAAGTRAPARTGGHLWN